MKKISFIVLLASAILLIGCKPDPSALYRITYLGNGNTSGFPPIESNLYKYGESAVVLEKGTLLQTGYEFKHWNTKQDDSGDAYIGGETIIVQGAVFLYAIWE